MLVFGSDKLYKKIKQLINNPTININHQLTVQNIELLPDRDKFKIVVVCLDKKTEFSDYYPILCKIFTNSYFVVLSDTSDIQKVAAYIRLGAYTVVDYKKLDELVSVIENLSDRIINKVSGSTIFNINPLVFKKLLEQVEYIAVQGYDNRGNVVYWNKGSQNLYGYTPKEVKGKNVSDLIIPTHLKTIVVDEIGEITKKNLINPARNITLKHKGGYDVVVTSYYTIIETLPGVKEIFFIDIDQTQEANIQKGVEIEKAYLKSLFESSPLAIVVLNNNDLLIDCNKHFELLFGYSKSEATGKNLTDLIVPNTLKDEGIMITNMVAGGETTYHETVRKNKSGKLIDVSIIGKPVVIDEKQIAVLGIYQDIGTRKESERALTIAKEKAESSDNIKSVFLKNISHEIRTPLNGIMGFASLLTNNDISIGTRKDYNNMLQQSCDRLLKTITNYIDASLLMSNNIVPRFTEVALDRLIFDTHENYYEIVDSKQITFSMSLPENSHAYSLKTDPDLLKKIINHLLDNAIKYTAEGLITLGFDIDNKYLKIFVEDTGIGIPLYETDKLFRPFSRIDDQKTPQYDGSGLSLSVSKNIANLINGEILFDSTFGKGSRFEIVFERKHVSETGKSDPIKSTANISAGNSAILIADDDKISRILLERILTSMTNLPVFQAKNGKEAVQLMAENQNISLVFMDLKMPVMDGYEATRHIKQTKNKIAIVAVTAFTTEQEDIFDDYITKPYSTEQIVLTLKKFGISTP